MSVEKLADTFLSFIPAESTKGILPQAVSAARERRKKALTDALYVFKQNIIDEVVEQYELKLPVDPQCE